MPLPIGLTASFRSVVPHGLSGRRLYDRDHEGTGGPSCAWLIPDFAHDNLTGDVAFPQPIAEIADVLSSARNRGDDAVRIGSNGGHLLVAAMNNELAGSTQVIDRIYWSVSLSPIARILDIVRTNLVDLVAEMRAGTPGGDFPSQQTTEQAVDVAICGRRNRVVINQGAPTARSPPPLLEPPPPAATQARRRLARSCGGWSRWPRSSPRLRRVGALLAR